jgi:hypothetical protein
VPRPHRETRRFVGRTSRHVGKRCVPWHSTGEGIVHSSFPRLTPDADNPVQAFRVAMSLMSVLDSSASSARRSRDGQR